MNQRVVPANVYVRKMDTVPRCVGGGMYTQLPEYLSRTCQNYNNSNLPIIC